MAAFDKILSGHPQLDEILDHIRLGDTLSGKFLPLMNFVCLPNLSPVRRSVTEEA